MEPRVLAPESFASFDDYSGSGGGEGLAAARRLGADGVLDEVEASGLRGRGGAGFPTGRKWRTVASLGSVEEPKTVVVNAAEGEPGTFKDRAVIRANPYAVVEGAVLAAIAVTADRVVIALKSSFEREAERLRAAVDDFARAGWSEGVDIEVFQGPEEYLFGEETGLLEALNGRPPFPRLVPPYRYGAEEVGEGPTASQVELASPGRESTPPTLVNNAETLANVPGILARGADWFREVGTGDSPGTIVCTVTGATQRHGVGEVPMGTPLAEVIESIGGGLAPGRSVIAVLSGAANPLLPGDRLDTPVSYEGLQEAGAGLGSAGFIVVDDGTDLLAVVEGVSRFLAVESCGQCTPCKRDGLAIADALLRIRTGHGNEYDLGEAAKSAMTVAEGARCFLAHQHQAVVGSLLELFPDAARRHFEGAAGDVEPYLVAPITDIVDGRAQLDERFATKQPDWTFGEGWSGKWPAQDTDERFLEDVRR